MRFSTVLVSLVAASGFVAAQSSSTNTSSAPAPTNTSSYDKVTVACLEGCKEDDVNCRAACFGNPHPDEAAVNATTQCAMKCEQGKGSEEETKKYAECQQACIKSLFLTTTGGVPKSTGSSTSSSAGSKATDSDGDKDSNEDSNEDNTDGDNKDEAKTDDKDSGAGKLAVSAGGAIALAFVALAL